MSKEPKEPKYCVTPNCANDRAPYRKLCDTCRSRRYRERNPLSITYIQLKINAGKRGIPFLLTFTFFRKFCEETNYLNLRGRGANDMTIDRKIPRYGYADGNIQMMTRADNARKRWKDSHYELSTKQLAGTPF